MDYTLRVLLAVIILRSILNVLLWLKELVVHQASRLAVRTRGNAYSLVARQAIGRPLYR